VFALGNGLATIVSFMTCLAAVEEIPCSIHLGEWLPPGFSSAREQHMAHHDRADTRFNVFLPLFDWLFGTAKA
jgi:sterol desaturase/sphingolipid hydroxylase (fatty acid hydroxylase superfamily)